MASACRRRCRCSLIACASPIRRPLTPRPLTTHPCTPCARCSRLPDSQGDQGLVRHPDQAVVEPPGERMHAASKLPPHMRTPCMHAAARLPSMHPRAPSPSPLPPYLRTGSLGPCGPCCTPPWAWPATSFTRRAASPSRRCPSASTSRPWCSTSCGPRECGPRGMGARDMGAWDRSCGV
jgi:hypothetical protein